MCFTADLQFLTQTFGAGTPLFVGVYILLYGGTPTFGKEGSGTPVFKILVIALLLVAQKNHLIEK